MKQETLNTLKTGGALVVDGRLNISLLLKGGCHALHGLPDGEEPAAEALQLGPSSARLWGLLGADAHLLSSLYRRTLRKPSANIDSLPDSFRTRLERVCLDSKCNKKTQNGRSTVALLRFTSASDPPLPPSLRSLPLKSQLKVERAAKVHAASPANASSPGDPPVRETEDGRLQGRERGQQHFSTVAVAQNITTTCKQ